MPNDIIAPEHGGVNPRSVADAWRRHAAELAAWTWKNLVNRDDCSGQYIEVGRRKDADLNSYTDKARLTPAKLQSHYRGASTGHIRGLHSTSTANTSRWGAVDVDRHGEEGNPGKNMAAALAWSDRAKALGLSVLLIDSNGRGGYHPLILFDRPIPTERVYAFLSLRLPEVADARLERARTGEGPGDVPEAIEGRAGPVRQLAAAPRATSYARPLVRSLSGKRVAGGRGGRPGDPRYGRGARVSHPGRGAGVGREAGPQA
jgi:hypothetical protein